MTTVLEARSSEGSLIGRCNAKCHTAKGDTCNCICAGKNHGVGLEQAIENSRELAQSDRQDIEYVTRLSQLGLFTQEKEQEPR